MFKNKTSGSKGGLSGGKRLRRLERGDLLFSFLKGRLTAKILKTPRGYWREERYIRKVEKKLKQKREQKKSGARRGNRKEAKIHLGGRVIVNIRRVLRIMDIKRN